LGKNYKPPRNSGNDEESIVTVSSNKSTVSTSAANTKNNEDNSNLEDWNWKNDINYQLNAVIIHHG